MKGKHDIRYLYIFQKIFINLNVMIVNKLYSKLLHFATHINKPERNSSRDKITLNFFTFPLTLYWVNLVVKASTCWDNIMCIIQDRCITCTYIVFMLEMISMEHIITWINLFANRIKIKYLTYKVFDQWNRHTTIPTSIVSNHEGFTSFCVKWDVLWNQKTEKKIIFLLKTLQLLTMAWLNHF